MVSKAGTVTVVGGGVEGRLGRQGGPAEAGVSVSALGGTVACRGGYGCRVGQKVRSRRSWRKSFQRGCRLSRRPQPHRQRLTASSRRSTRPHWKRHAW